MALVVVTRGWVQLGGDGEELGATVLPLGQSLKVRTSHKQRGVFFRHHLIHSGAEGGGGNAPRIIPCYPSLMGGVINRLSRWGKVSHLSSPL
jgi:hypothetical protein